MARPDVDGAIDRVLNDPMTRAIMRADGVDRDELRHTLRSLAAERATRAPRLAWAVRVGACRREDACAW